VSVTVKAPVFCVDTHSAGQMANGKDFFVELRKQITEKLLERDHEDKAKTKEVAAPAKGG
jgi:hypothetical protein